MTGSPGEESSDKIGGPKVEKPDPAPLDARRPTPSRSGEAPNVARWHRRPYVWIAVAVVAVGAIVTGLLVAGPSGRKNSRATPSPTTPPAARSLPPSAVHDANGLITTLPSISRVLGKMPLPGISLSGDDMSAENLDGNIGIHEVDSGTTDTDSEYRSLTVAFTRFATTGIADRAWGKKGHDAYRKDQNNWYSATTPISGLGCPGYVYRNSGGPYHSIAANVEFNYVGPMVEARYKNVIIRIDFESANFARSRDGRVKVSYGSYPENRARLIVIARNLVDHL